MTLTMMAPRIGTSEMIAVFPPADLCDVVFALDKRVTPGQPLPERDARRVEEMRRAVEARLRKWQCHHLVDDLLLIVSELVTNALEHGDGETIRLTLSWSCGLVHLRVVDGSEKRPAMKCPAPEAENGRGLLIVGAIALVRTGKWGVSEDNSTTWCTIPVHRPEQSLHTGSVFPPWEPPERSGR
ncbi:ATP-binding protein [Streptomyces sp. NPDC058256]|uniref:ATP-binding protein n=1 Tax=Streptomyces sp. NPDC058256 TaxID=3346408 RepID=UPI0036E49CD5